MEHIGKITLTKEDISALQKNIRTYRDMYALIEPAIPCSPETPQNYAAATHETYVINSSVAQFLTDYTDESVRYYMPLDIYIWEASTPYPYRLWRNVSFTNWKTTPTEPPEEDE